MPQPPRLWVMTWTISAICNMDSEDLSVRVCVCVCVCIEKRVSVRERKIENGERRDVEEKGREEKERERERERPLGRRKEKFGLFFSFSTIRCSKDCPTVCISVCVSAIMYECVCNIEYERECVRVCVCVLPTSSYKIRRSVDNLLQLRRGYDDPCWHRLKWRVREDNYVR